MFKRFYSISLLPISGPRFTLLAAMLAALMSGSLLHGAPVTGTVRSIDPERLAITLETPEGLREFLVGRGDRAILQPGDIITAESVRQGQSWRLETVFPDSPEPRAILERTAHQLRRDTLRRGSKVFRTVGERIPRFALWDQDGDLFLSDSLRGNYAVINFVFTRCAMQEMCPAATERMIQMDKMLDERGWDDVKLVSITLDPAYDTPGIWTAYALDKGIDVSRHTLLGGPVEVVEDLKQQLGILAEPDERQIVRHTMSTALVDPTGKIIYRIPGSMWSPDVFLRQIEEDRAED